MKKTLIALAAVAAATGAMAQSTVTLSGKLAFAYETERDYTNAKTTGLRVTDGDFVIKATEDLGGGLKVTADMAVQSRGRDTAISGRDAKITIAGGFGSVMIGAIEAGNGIIGLGGAGADTIGLDNGGFATSTALGVLDAAGNVDILRYTSPTMAGFNVYVSVLDTPGAGGMESASTKQDAKQIGLRYSAGPLNVAADYVSWGRNSAGVTILTDLGGIAGVTADDRLRVSASYDLGMAVIGAGYQTYDRNSTGNVLGDNDQYILGVNVPMGAFSFGYNYGSHKQETTLGTAKVKGHDLGVTYALSKRTNIRLAHQTNTAKFNGVKIGKSWTITQVRLMHSF